jgi:predicted nucleic acid-binding protein
MRLVVADTGPLHYLIMTGDIALLATLFDKVLVPQTVRDELAHRNAPDLVREWIAQPPPWLSGAPTLGVLDLAARRGLIDLAEAFSRLKATSSYYRQGLLDSLLARRRDEESEQR